jgi:hypothetical protein
LGTVHILPAVPPSTTDQVSPPPAAVPSRPHGVRGPRGTPHTRHFLIEREHLVESFTVDWLHPAFEQLFTTNRRVTKSVDLDGFRAKAAEAWARAHESHFAALDAALTELIPALESATYCSGSADLRALHGLRARACQAASAAFARQDETDAAWIAAERALTAAQQSGTPLEVIAEHLRMAHAFIRLGRYDQAEHLTTSALNAVAPVADSEDATPETLSLYGAMHLVQAVISGHESDRSAARAHLATPSGSRRGSGPTATTSTPSPSPPTCTSTRSPSPSTWATQAKQADLLD